jgi:signal transduction histidine kinase
MSQRVWFRSLYWRIAIGYVALLALLLVIQAALFLWLTNRMWGRASRSPAEVAQYVADDVSAALQQSSGLDLQPYLERHFGTGYRPFVIVLRDGRHGSNRPSAVLPQLGRDARIRLMLGDRAAERDRIRAAATPARPRFAEYADILVNADRVGLVAVPEAPPPFAVGLRELAPTLAWVGVGLIAVGAGLLALLIFRPTHRRLRSLEDAARALGEGRTDVRANESGGDEVSGLSRTFNRMAGDLQTRAAALGEADRSRRQLLADVSHELMTPLAAIRGYLETLSMPELRLDAATRGRYLDIAHHETHKLEAIIGDLLDLARLEGGGDTMARDEVFVGDLFRRVVDRHQPVLSERHVGLEVEIDEHTPHVVGDADRLEQAIQNVAANAIRHTPEGGTVALTAEPAGDLVRIRISDTGPGIPPEHLPHIFDRFYKADAARSGTGVPSGSGLGLSIVRAIVARHGGSIRAANGPAGGAIFEMLLPAVRPSTVDVTVANAGRAPGYQVPATDSLRGVPRP